MSSRFLFDECLGRPMMDQLRAVVPNDPTFAHVCDFFKPGTLDKDWIPRIAEEKWVVISGDRGRKSNRGGKLPALCKEHRITCVLLSAALQDEPAHKKLGILAANWETIAAVQNDTPGSRFILRYKPTRRADGLIVVLQKWEEKA